VQRTRRFGGLWHNTTKDTTSWAVTLINSDAHELGNASNYAGSARLALLDHPNTRQALHSKHWLIATLNLMPVKPESKQLRIADLWTHTAKSNRVIPDILRSKLFMDSLSIGEIALRQPTLFLDLMPAKPGMEIPELSSGDSQKSLPPMKSP